MPLTPHEPSQPVTGEYHADNLTFDQWGSLLEMLVMNPMGIRGFDVIPPEVLKQPSFFRPDAGSGDKAVALPGLGELDNVIHMDLQAFGRKYDALFDKTSVPGLTEDIAEFRTALRQYQQRDPAIKVKAGNDVSDIFALIIDKLGDKCPSIRIRTADGKTALIENAPLSTGKKHHHLAQLLFTFPYIAVAIYNKDIFPAKIGALIGDEITGTTTSITNAMSAVNQAITDQVKNAVMPVYQHNGQIPALMQKNGGVLNALSWRFGDAAVLGRLLRDNNVAPDNMNIAAPQDGVDALRLLTHYTLFKGGTEWAKARDLALEIIEAACIQGKSQANRNALLEKFTAELEKQVAILRKTDTKTLTPELSAILEKIVANTLQSAQELTATIPTPRANAIERGRAASDSPQAPTARL